MTRDETVDMIARVLLSHDTKGDYSSQCICEERLWNEGKPGMARHRAERIVDALERSREAEPA